MTIAQTINTASMIQSYRQLNASKEEKEAEITLDSSSSTQESNSSQTLDLQYEIAQMKATWLMDSSLTSATSPEARLMEKNSLSSYFGYDKQGFRDSLAGTLNDDAIMQKKFGLWEQNPRYADAIDYRMIHDGEVMMSNPEYSVQISVFHSPTGEISIIDKGYSRSDFNIAANTIEKMLDRVLEEQFQKDPNSKETNILLLLKAKVQAMPEIIEQIRANATDYTRKAIDEGNEEALELALYTADLEIASELRIFHDIGVKLKQYLSPEQQQQIANAEETIINYYQNNWDKDFAFKGFEPTTRFALEEAAKALAEKVKNVAIEDNTETLLELGAEKRANYASIMGEEIARENVLNRAKKPTSDDSILQQVMSKITNGVKTAEAGGLRIAN